MPPMTVLLAAAALLATGGAAAAAVAPAPADPDRTHFPAATNALPAGVVAPVGVGPPFSAAVRAGRTLYVAGTTDRDPATGKPGVTPTAAAKLVLDSFRKSVTAGGASMDDLVWVQVFCSDLANFDAFNGVYRTYFRGPMPARAFLGVDHLLGGAHYEVMGIAVIPAQ